MFKKQEEGHCDKNLGREKQGKEEEKLKSLCLVHIWLDFNYIWITILLLLNLSSESLCSLNSINLKLLWVFCYALGISIPKNGFE